MLKLRNKYSAMRRIVESGATFEERIAPKVSGKRRERALRRGRAPEHRSAVDRAAGTFISDLGCSEYDVRRAGVIGAF